MNPGTSDAHDFWPEFAVALALACLMFILYACFLSKSYVFEGLARAMPIDTGHLRHLFAGNYLLYGPLGYAFHSFLRFSGVNQPAVFSLQLMDALLGAAGLFVYFLILRRLNAGIASAAAWSIALGVSLGYWYWSTDAEDYILSTFLLEINFLFLVLYAKQKIGSPAVLGALHALAMLGHIINALFGAVILWFLIASNPKKWKGPVAQYALTSGALITLFYSYTIVFIQKQRSLHAAARWFLGSAATQASGVNLGGSFTLAKVWQWIQMTGHIFLSFKPPYVSPPAMAVSRYFISAGWILLAMTVCLFLRFARDILEVEKVVALGCVIWIASYASTFLHWQPWTMVYRVSDLTPLWILLFLAGQRLARRSVWGQALGWGLALAIGAGNFGAEIYPRSFATNNGNLQRMLFIKTHTAENDWITGAVGVDEIYIPYFAERRPIVMDRFIDHPQDLIHWMDGLLAHGQFIYTTSDDLRVSRWEPIFEHYRLKPAAQASNGFSLFQITHK